MDEASTLEGQAPPGPSPGLNPRAMRPGGAAAAVSVLCGVVLAYLTVPEVVPLPVVSHRAPAAAPVVSSPVLKITVPPVLRTPFTPGHETRQAPPAPAAESKPAGKAPEKRPAKPRKAPVRPRLTGIVTTGPHSMALIARGSQTMTLAPGETRGTVTLLEIRDGSVRVRDENGEYQLFLPGREEENSQ